MAQESNPGSVSDAIGYALVEHADRIGKSIESTREALSEQIEHFKELQQWTVGAVKNLQQRVDGSIQKLEVERQKFEAERVRLQTAQVNFERNAVQAIHDAVRKQSGDIERQTVQAFAEPLHTMKQAAGYVRQHMKEIKWLTTSVIFAGGLIVGMLLGYWPMRSSQNAMQEQLNRIEQYLATQQPPAPTAPDPHAPAHKGKAK